MPIDNRDDGAFDDNGINVADPHDRLGHKSEYITLLQEMALREAFVGSGRALEIGCGFGRLTPTIERLGYDTVAVDPSVRLLQLARRRSSTAAWCAAALPDLPFASGSFDIVFMINVLRVLHLMGMKDVADGIPRVLAPSGRLVVLDNLSRADDRYVKEAWITEQFRRHGLRLVSRRAIRAGRWPGIFAVQFGLVPRRWLPALACLELRRMARRSTLPRWTYHNVIYVFENVP